MAKSSSGSADRRQAARAKAREIAQAQERREKTAKTILYTGIGVIVVAVLVIVGVLIFNSSRPAPGPATYAGGGITFAKSTPVQPPDLAKDEKSSLPKPADEGVKEGAPHIKVYLDFQCPACASFEDTNSATLKKLVEEGSATVEYQPLAILDNMSGGNKYSSRTANLVACVADSQPQKFPDLVAAIFAQQPEEQGNGRSDEELLAVAKKAGVDLAAPTKAEDTPSVQKCFTEGTYDKFVEQSTQKALKSGIEQTPTVLINGKPVTDWSDKEQFALEILRAGK